MEYIGFIIMIIGVGGLDSNPVISGIMAITGLLIIAIKSRNKKECRINDKVEERIKDPGYHL